MPVFKMANRIWPAWYWKNGFKIKLGKTHHQINLYSLILDNQCQHELGRESLIVSYYCGNQFDDKNSRIWIYAETYNKDDDLLIRDVDDYQLDFLLGTITNQRKVEFLRKTIMQLAHQGDSNTPIFKKTQAIIDQHINKKYKQASHERYWRNLAKNK